MAAEDISMNELKQDLATLRADFGNLMTAMKDLGVEQGQRAYGQMRETGERARDQARVAQENVEQYIESRPLTSVLVAFGTGFAIGTVLSNRHH